MIGTRSPIRAGASGSMYQNLRGISIGGRKEGILHAFEHEHGQVVGLSDSRAELQDGVVHRSEDLRS